jgi:hypothetical protein
VVDDVAAEAVQVHALAHHLAADKHVREEWGVEGAHASHTHVHLRAAAAQSDVGERPPFGVVIAVMLVLGG